MRLKTLAVAAAAIPLAFAASANAATLFTADLTAEQSTTPSPGFDGQSGDATLSLNQDEDGAFSLSMTLTFFGALDFTAVEDQFGEVEGEAAGGGEVVNGLHLHTALPGVGGPIVFSLADLLDGTPITGPTDADDQSLNYNDDGSVTIESEWDLNEGVGDFTLASFVPELLGAADEAVVALYFNLHTTTAPGGLIRGQVVGANAAVPLPGAVALFVPAILGGAALRRRRRAA